MDNINIVLGQFKVISAEASLLQLSGNPVDGCREIAKKASRNKTFLADITGELADALRKEWNWIEARVQTGTINRVPKRARAALYDVQERADVIVSLLQSAVD